MDQQFDWTQLQNGSDIRGIAMEGVPGEAVNLTPERVVLLGEAFVRWLQQRYPSASLKIAVGMDSRLTGPSFMEVLERRMVEMGVAVLNCGLASTPAMFSSTVLPGIQADGAIMFTASHLPFNRNGMKFFTSTGGLEKGDITALLMLASGSHESSNSEPGRIHITNLIAAYSNHLVRFARQSIADPERYDQPLTGLNIVVDAGNGSGGFYANRVLKALGADVNGSQFLDPDGRFPNHVPNPEDQDAMESICHAVRASQADLGIIFDTDVDRAAFVDEQGNIVNRNELVALTAAIVLQEHPSTTVVTDSITSDGLSWFITEKLKGKHHRFKRGYKNVINEGIRLNSSGEDCWLAIETSGHAALRENFFLDDGAYLATKIVIQMARLRSEGRRLSDLISALPRPYESKEYRLRILTVPFAGKGNEIIEKLSLFAEQQEKWQVVENNYEGVRVSCRGEFEKGWFLLRLSLHDPVLPLNIESEMAGGVYTIASRLRRFFEDIDGLELPRWI